MGQKIPSPKVDGEMLGVKPEIPPCYHDCVFGALEKDESHARLNKRIAGGYQTNQKSHSQDLINPYHLSPCHFSIYVSLKHFQESTLNSHRVLLKKNRWFLKKKYVSVLLKMIFLFLLRCFFVVWSFFGSGDSSTPRQGLDYSAALELATLGRKAKECGRRPSQGETGRWFRGWFRVVLCVTFFFFNEKKQGRFW